MKGGGPRNAAWHLVPQPTRIDLSPQTDMNRTHWHLTSGVVWLVTVLVVAVNTVSHTADFGANQFRSQLASLMAAVGLGAIFLSWAKADAPAHGKPEASAFVFAALWPILFFVAHVAYLFYTRGLRNGVLAILKFACFVMASLIVLFVAGRLGSSIVN